VVIYLEKVQMICIRTL